MQIIDFKLAADNRAEQLRNERDRFQQLRNAVALVLAHTEGRHASAMEETAEPRGHSAASVAYAVGRIDAYAMTIRELQQVLEDHPGAAVAPGIAPGE